MVRQAVRKIVEFSVGVAVGGAIGAGIGYLTAPASGDDLRQEGHDLIASAKHAGERARIDREAELRDKFRDQVGDRQALASPAETITPANGAAPERVHLPV